VFDFTLGNICFQQDDLPAAAKWYRAAVEKFPSFQRAHKNLGIVSVRTGDYPAAIASLTRMLELGGGDALSYGMLGFSYLQTQDFLAAESAYRSALLLQPRSVEWRMGLARCLFRQQNFSAAVALCDELLRQHPQRADLWLLQANAFIGLREPARAAENYEMVIRLGAATVEMLHTLGDIYINAGTLDLAARAYRQAWELQPTQPLVRPLRNLEVLVARGALSEARELITLTRRETADRISDAEQRQLLKLDARVAAAEGQGAAAVKTLEEIVALDPLDGDALLLLGQHYSKQGDPARAQFSYERAANLAPFEADAKLRLAQLLVTQAKFAEAVPLLKRANELKPQESVARYLDQVERIAKSRR
jgi:Flp pilus assembly protein TadD